jgi:gamma-glutamyl hercynylcysteine S-oxide synthase
MPGSAAVLTESEKAAPRQPGGVQPAATRDAVRELLDRVRARTLLLLAPLDGADARMQHDPLMSPIVWDLGHIASFERLWLQEQLDRPVSFGEMPGLYNPFEHPRRERGALPLPSLEAVLAELESVRARTLERLDRIELDDRVPLLRDGYVYRMVVQHEAQHQETILQTLQLMQGAPYPAPRAWSVPGPPPQAPSVGAMVRFSGGPAVVGTDDRAAAYDNERPPHTVVLAPFEIDVYAVTNGAYLEFVADGGYGDRRLWSDAGAAWLAESGVTAPKHWQRTGGVWTERYMDVVRELDPRRPVCHVCYYEADAFARWAGKRLPTELEWEVAATGGGSNERRRYPWGDSPADPSTANVDQLAFDTAPAGAYAASASPLGVQGMIGDVWEWTSSEFGPYPGFTSFPYAEYSEPFFGSEHKVLRGGSWATASHVARATFRNWDFPIRRQIFSGFRCARGA